jgi:hypothetical protein
MTTHQKPNRLLAEKSPYLLQHAYNPVEWFPWSEEAFEKAKSENKPIFLSIGYSTCHWCHVMERESFEDEEVAAILNKHFVSVKVDREERPDVDHLYMSVCQAMTGQGGWPLTIIMTPDKKPFFAGTYFPKKRKYGRIGLIDLLHQVSEKWQQNRDDIQQFGEQVAEEMSKRLASTGKGEISEDLLKTAFSAYADRFDPDYGGFGNAPKFPTSHNLSFLLRYYKKTGEKMALEMVEKTLDAMHRGGIYDHIGFGFARYSTDEEWLVPHFEKMLYDNALLAMTFTEAYQLTDKERYADVARQIFTYILRDMTDPAGGFYSAEDADSEGVEGKFYVWTPEEIRAVLGPEDGELFCSLYDITPEGNFEGHSIPNLIQETPEEFARRRNIPLAQLEEKIERLRQKLFAYREQRVHPHKDDKILTSWNGLMIAALAKAGRVLKMREYTQAAEKAADFVLNHLRRDDGRLLARYRDGEAKYPGYLDDYAFFVWGLIELYEATFELRYLKLALELNEETLRLFWDDENGGFFFYGHDSEQLFSRIKEIYDGAIPSGNSVEALNLFRLSRFTGRKDLEQRAEEQLQAFAGTVSGYPAGYAMFMMAVSFYFGPSQEIVVAGSKEREDTKEMLETAQRAFLPNAVLIFHPADDDRAEVQKLLPVTAGKDTVSGRAAVYICENFACQAPSTEPSVLHSL